MSYIYIVIIEESGGKVKKRFRIVDIRFVNVAVHGKIMQKCTPNVRRRVV